MVEARIAATVILLRDSPGGVEVFLMERHAKSDFVGGAYVFPGGRVDPEDQVEEALCAGADDASASRRLDLEAGGLALYVAAIRECFEEAGVLLAYGADGELVSFREPETEDRFKSLRLAMNSRALSLSALARQEGLRLATDHMHYWAHWITPKGQPKRFDTRFFLAVAPQDQTATHDDWELTASAWVTPQEALERARRGEWKIILPTLRNLQSLLPYATTSQAVKAARGKTEIPVMQPRVQVRGEEVVLVLPGDPGYEEAEPDTSKVDPRFWRKLERKDRR